METEWNNIIPTELEMRKYIYNEGEREKLSEEYHDFTMQFFF